MAMSVKVFDGLTNSDFQNGAVRDEIKHSLKELERINEYFAQQAVEADAYRRCEKCGGIIGSYSAACNSDQHTCTA